MTSLLLYTKVNQRKTLLSHLSSILESLLFFLSFCASSVILVLAIAGRLRGMSQFDGLEIKAIKFTISVVNNCVG